MLLFVLISSWIFHVVVCPGIYRIIVIPRIFYVVVCSLLMSQGLYHVVVNVDVVLEYS